MLVQVRERGAGPNVADSAQLVGSIVLSAPTSATTACLRLKLRHGRAADDGRTVFKRRTGVVTQPVADGKRKESRSRIRCPTTSWKCCRYRRRRSQLPESGVLLYNNSRAKTERGRTSVVIRSLYDRSIDRRRKVQEDLPLTGETSHNHKVYWLTA